MPTLSNPTTVQALLGANYGLLPDGTAPDLQQYIDSADVVVQRVIVCAANKGMSLSPTEQELIERWLSCYFYCKMDPLYQSRSTAGASGSFVNAGMNAQIDGDADRYKRGAIELDATGCLNAILNRKAVRLLSVGGRGGCW